MAVTKQDIQQKMNEALKAGRKQRVAVLRMLLSEMNNAQLAGADPAEAVAAYGRRLEKSIAEYRDLGCEAEAERIEQELAVVAEFMPRRLSDEETEALVDRVIAEEGLASMKDIGRGMKAVMSAHGQQVDGRTVQELFKKKLGG